jgi:putative tryptophan/tyrosine transport system substrate-binding protein
MSTRRTLLRYAPWLGLLTLPAIAQTSKVWRVGILASGSPASSGHLYNAFVQGLQERGYDEARNVVIERRFANGNIGQLSALASELVQSKVDVILASNSIAVQSAKLVAGDTPIVFCSVDDPVGSGFVVSLAHPGRTITGIANMQNELSAKRLQILKEAFPKTSRVAIFVTSREPISNVQLDEVLRAAKLLNIKTFPLEVTQGQDIDSSLASLRNLHVDSIYTLETSVNFANRSFLIEIAARAKLPAIFPTPDYVRSGGLMTYSGLSGEALFKRAAYYVDKILKGAKRRIASGATNRIFSGHQHAYRQSARLEDSGAAVAAG